MRAQREPRATRLGDEQAPAGEHGAAVGCRERLGQPQLQTVTWRFELQRLALARAILHLQHGPARLAVYAALRRTQQRAARFDDDRLRRKAVRAAAPNDRAALARRDAERLAVRQRRLRL